jgi:hypothetical protein
MIYKQKGDISKKTTGSRLSRPILTPSGAYGLTTMQDGDDPLARSPAQDIGTGRSNIPSWPDARDLTTTSRKENVAPDQSAASGWPEPDVMGLLVSPRGKIIGGVGRVEIPSSAKD